MDDMKAKMGKHGPLRDYCGAHVIDWRGRLATIVEVYRNHHRCEDCFCCAALTVVEERKANG